MTTKTLKKERRQYPRYEQQLPVKIAANGYDFATTTQNISCLGAYCHVSKYIPPFTKIMVKFSLPLNSGEVKSYCLECRGAVVRSEDTEDGGFNIAIFFNKIGDSQRHKISQYLSQFLPQY